MPLGAAITSMCFIAGLYIAISAGKLTSGVGWYYKDAYFNLLAIGFGVGILLLTLGIMFFVHSLKAKK